MADARRLDGLQILRFFAAFAVLLEHVMHEALGFGIADRTLAVLEPYDFGVGVDVFFVISGFIMYYISADAFGRPGAQARFLPRRIIRLVPLYWLFTLAMLAAMLLVPGQLAHTVLDPLHILASFLFVPWLDSTGLPHPLLGLGWTLNYEMYFYVLFSFALLLPRRAGLAALAGLFAGLALLHALTAPTQVQLAFWSDPIILEFIFGIGLAVLVTRGMRLPRRMPMSLIGLGAIGLLFAPSLGLAGPFARLLESGVPAALLVAGTVFAAAPAPSRLTGWLVLGGDASFALYLSHPFSINLLILAWQKLHLDAPWLFVATCLVVAIGAAIMVHLVIEKPLLAYLNRGARPTPLPATPALTAGK